MTFLWVIAVVMAVDVASKIVQLGTGEPPKDFGPLARVADVIFNIILLMWAVAVLVKG